VKLQKHNSNTRGMFGSVLQLFRRKDRVVQEVDVPFKDSWLSDNDTSDEYDKSTVSFESSGALSSKSAVEELSSLCRKSCIIYLSLTRPYIDTIRVKPPLGLRLKGGRNHLLCVVAVFNGSIKEWNDKNPHRRIGPGDRLLSVNGVSNVSKKTMIDKFMVLDEVEITFNRYPAC